MYLHLLISDSIGSECCFHPSTCVCTSSDDRLLVGSILLGLSALNSYIQPVPFSWRVKPSPFSYHSTAWPSVRHAESSCPAALPRFCSFRHIIFMCDSIDGVGLFSSSSGIYTFISCQNVTSVSSPSWHGDLSSILCMAAPLITIFPRKIITSLILKGSLAGNRNLSWWLISFRIWEPSFRPLRVTC